MISRPTSDVITTGWTPSVGAFAYATIDEVTPDDGDYVSRAIDAHDALVVGLGATVAVGTHRVALRLGTNAGAASVRAHLMDGASAIVGSSAWQDASTAPTTYTFQITTAANAARLGIEVVPDTTLLDENGDPLLTEGGEYILEG